MTSRNAKTRYNKRERRKAKQSGWKREPKRNPKKCGHGPN